MEKTISFHTAEELDAAIAVLDELGLGYHGFEEESCYSVKFEKPKTVNSKRFELEQRKTEALERMAEISNIIPKAKSFTTEMTRYCMDLVLRDEKFDGGEITIEPLQLRFRANMEDDRKVDLSLDMKTFEDDFIAKNKISYKQD